MDVDLEEYAERNQQLKKAVNRGGCIYVNTSETKWKY